MIFGQRASAPSWELGERRLLVPSSNTVARWRSREDAEEFVVRAQWSACRPTRAGYHEVRGFPESYRSGCVRLRCRVNVAAHIGEALGRKSSPRAVVFTRSC